MRVGVGRKAVQSPANIKLIVSLHSCLTEHDIMALFKLCMQLMDAKANVALHGGNLCQLNRCFLMTTVLDGILNKV